MDFEFSKEQLEIQNAVKDFCKGEYSKELAFELDEKHEFPQKLFKYAADLGFIGIGFLEAYSGQGLGCIENTIIVEEFCRADSTIGTALALSYFASECILHFGSDEMMERCYPQARLQNRIMVRILPAWTPQLLKMVTSG